jgi:hypothetical protein
MKTDEDTMVIEWTVDLYSSSTHLIKTAPVGYRVQSISRNGTEAKVTYKKINKETEDENI